MASRENPGVWGDQHLFPQRVVSGHCTSPLPGNVFTTLQSEPKKMVPIQPNPTPQASNPEPLPRFQIRMFPPSEPLVQDPGGSGSRGLHSLCRDPRRVAWTFIRAQSSDVCTWMAEGQNQWYHFGVFGAPPILVDLVGIGMFTEGAGF